MREQRQKKLRLDELRRKKEVIAKYMDSAATEKEKLDRNIEEWKEVARDVLIDLKDMIPRAKEMDLFVFCNNLRVNPEIIGVEEEL